MIMIIISVVAALCGVAIIIACSDKETQDAGAFKKNNH